MNAHIGRPTHNRQVEGLSFFGPTATKHRPPFEQAINSLQSDDTLMIWKIDRAFRAMPHELDTLELLNGWTLISLH
jgi:DNA invertase Pin-like site-specific DNA recombinase